MARRDLTGDGVSDILWRQQGSGLVGVWDVNHDSVTWSAWGTLPGTWRTGGVGDLDGDGWADVTWVRSDPVEQQTSPLLYGSSFGMDRVGWWEMNGLDIEALTDVALKTAEVQGGILVVERQFGYLEIHSRDVAAVKASAEAVLSAMGMTPDKAMKPKILASRIVTRIDPGHAFLINRNKGGSMVLAGETLFVLETEPAAYAILAANAAEKAATIKIVDYRMIGATGRLYLSGTESETRAAAVAAEQALVL